MPEMINSTKRLLGTIWSDFSRSWVLWFSMLLVALLFYHRPITFLFDEMVDSRLAAYDLLEDDAFYYLTVAKNIVETGTSSFDGIVRTNGYHPLWMLILVMLGYVAPVDSLTYILVLNMLIVATAAAGAYFFGRLRKCYTSDAFNSPVLFMYFYAAFFISRGGMEVALVFLLVPLLLLFSVKLVHRPSARLVLATSFTGALLVLSRLDTVILVLMLVTLVILYLQAERSIRLSTRQLVSLVIGFSPLMLYLVNNQIEYGALIPISGQAKALTTAPFFISQYGLKSVLDSVLRGHAVSLFFYVTLAALPVIVYRVARGRTYENWLLFIVGVFPFIFFLFHLSRSDWPYWQWYFYPLSISFPFSLMLFEMVILKKSFFYAKWRTLLVRTVGATVFLVVIIQYLLFSPRTYSPFPYVEAAVEVAKFAETHRGTYAMGDRAGSVAFLLPYPLIQLEGLVGDSRMLAMIAEERNLVEVLRHYEVDY